MTEHKLELTIKAVVIGLILSIVFCGTNIYLGLKIGNTISASVPAAIIAMTVLRMFKKYSTLENSISQTTASVGEGLATAVIFVFPSLLILHRWDDFNYTYIIMSILPGAIIGVVYSVILRKVLLSDKQLGFPEGQAIGKVLETTEQKGNKEHTKLLIFGMVISGVTSFCQIGLQVLSDAVTKAFMVGGRLMGGGLSFSVAITSAGFLVGFAQMFVGFLGLIFAWCIMLPIFTGIHGIKDSTDLVGSAFYIWKNYIRPIGVGMFIFTGFATIIMLTKPIIRGIKESARALKDFTTIAQDKDLSINKLFVLVLLSCVPVVLMLLHQLASLNHFSVFVNLIISIIIVFLMLIIGFALAAVSGYFAGLAGSTSSPVSGLLFIAVIAVAIILQFACDFSIPHVKDSLLETTILMVGFIAGTAVITNGTIQDFKSGEMVGSTPYKQQITLFIGCVLSAIIAPLFISLIFHAYGIAGVVPVGSSIDPTHTLSAPQASAVAALTQNILVGSQDWSLIAYGVILGFIIFVLDIFGRKTGKFRCSVVSFGMGMYLPPDVTAALFIGGCIRLLVDKKQKKITETHGEQAREDVHNKVNLLVCGLIAGESLMGLLLAIPFVLYQSSDALKIVLPHHVISCAILAIIVNIFIFRYIYKVGTKI